MRLALLSNCAAVAALVGAQGAHAALSFYLDGQPAPGFAAYTVDEPLPVLGIHSSTVGAWSGYVTSDSFGLVNGQVNSAIVPAGGAGIVPLGPPYGYSMWKSVSSVPGVQFTMGMECYDWVGLSTMLLWNDASTFEVPADTLFVYRGGPPGISWSYLEADAGAGYSLAPGGSVTFDGSSSSVTALFWDEDEPVVFSAAGRALFHWNINGVDVAFGASPTITYETLVNGLGLQPGTYELTLRLYQPFYGQDSTTASIHIVPEPACGAVLPLLCLLRRRSR